MQHEHVLKKPNFDLMIQPQGQGMGSVGSVGKIFATKLLHFARGSFVDHIFLEAQCLARILQHVSPLIMAALSCNSLLYTLRILSKGLKNFPIQLFNPLSDSSCKDYALC